MLIQLDMSFPWYLKPKKNPSYETFSFVHEPL